MHITLVGGGPDTVSNKDVVIPFIAACNNRGARRIAVLLAGSAKSAEFFYPEYQSLLDGLTGNLEVFPLELGISAGQLTQFDAFVVCGGPTPVYLEALINSAETIQKQVEEGAPYIGFSAGAMIAAKKAIIGGHLAGDYSVCPVEWSEELEQTEVVPGLDIVPWTIETHASQAGLLGRAIEVVSQDLAPEVVAIDDDTALVLEDHKPPTTIGSGRTWWFESETDEHVTVRTETSHG